MVAAAAPFMPRRERWIMRQIKEKPLTLHGLDKIIPIPFQEWSLKLCHR
jgi:hypothetical protein